MNIKRLTLVAFLGFSLIMVGCGDSQKEYTETIIAMDTPMTLTAYGNNAEAAVKAGCDEAVKLDKIFSVTNKESEIYRLNENKSEVLSEETYELIKRAVNLGTKTDNTLDITIYPIVKKWGFTTGNYNVPNDIELEELKAHIGSDRLDFGDSEKKITINDSNTELDLGAVAKGYASDKISEIFKENGVTSGIISLGGNVRTIGEKPNGSLWKVAIADPKAPESFIGILEVGETAVVTSGSYQRYFERDGKIYHHIIDPKTCRPAESGLASVTIVSRDGTLADAYSTALFIMGKEKAAAFQKANSSEFDFVLIDNEGKIYVSKGLEDSFTLTDKTGGYELIE